MEFTRSFTSCLLRLFHMVLVQNFANENVFDTVVLSAVGDHWRQTYLRLRPPPLSDYLSSATSFPKYQVSQSNKSLYLEPLVSTHLS